MDHPTPPVAGSPRVPYGTLAAGFAALALGLALAYRHLPEWRATPVRDRAFVTNLTKAVAEAGGTLVKPRLTLEGATASARVYGRAFEVLPPGQASPYLVESGLILGYAVEGELRVATSSGFARIQLEPNGTPTALTWQVGSPFMTSAVARTDGASARALEAFLEKFALVLHAGRKPVGDVANYTSNNVPVQVQPLTLVPGRPAESLVRLRPPGRIYLSRQLATKGDRIDTSLAQLMRSWAFGILVGLMGIVLFGFRLFARRLNLRLALGIAGVALASMLLGGVSREETSSLTSLILTVAVHAIQAGVLLALWGAGESFLRETVPGFTTSLDALTAGRLGPREGRALLAGLGVGAAVTGVLLLKSAVAALLAGSGVIPTAPTFHVPPFAGAHSPLFEGPYDTAVFVLFVALLRKVAPKRLAEPLAAALFAMLISMSMPIEPWSAAFAASAAVSALYLFAFQRFGFAALLATTTVAALLRETLAAARFPSESLLALAIGLALLGATVLFGFVGLSRSSRLDEARVDAPEYVKEIEAQERVKGEMGLLSQMQLALLPERPPDIPGLDLAVKTTLATEAGGDLFDFLVDESGALWVAAGDVSGHGYSCAIQQAMVKAALVSLVKADRRPGEILSEVDRVLRSGKPGRHFTSLALLRLEPKTGRGLVANAGHPYPILVVEGKAREVAAPGFPLGQGPKRTYADLEVEIPVDGFLVFASDGLYEGPDSHDEPYGYARPIQVLEGVGVWRGRAEKIVETLSEDWRRHIGAGAPADDTTIVVIKRPGLSW